LQLGIVSNYDNVTRSARESETGGAKLEALTASQPALAPLLDDVRAYRESISKKNLIFQQVKASHAMLRNALSILPNIIAESYAQPEASAVLPGESRRVSDLIGETVNSVMSFLISPTAMLRADVEQKLLRNRNVISTSSPALRDAMQRLLAQIEVLTKERLRGNALSLQLAAAGTDAEVNKTAADLLSLKNERAQAAQKLWTIVVVLGIALALALLGLAYALSHRFLQLNKDNAMLQQINENVEEQLVQSAKLSALGQMVAGITHEINTPLAYVKAVFELIKERLLIEHQSEDERNESREELTTLLEDGLHGLDEIATLVLTMKNFSRLDKGNIELFSVEEGIESALLIARPQLKYVTDINKEFDGVPQIMASPTQLRQVFLNLIVNAADAMTSHDRHGVLTVRTRVTSSDTIQIDVCDNGPGVSEENLAKIFDPFFTTKPVGQGTGMGLSICYRIVENHGGTIAINSKLNVGTVVTVTLPKQHNTHLASDTTMIGTMNKLESA
jgi:signal transduction histidine kinase